MISNVILSYKDLSILFNCNKIYIFLNVNFFYDFV